MTRREEKDKFTLFGLRKEKEQKITCLSLYPLPYI